MGLRHAAHLKHNLEKHLFLFFNFIIKYCIIIYYLINANKSKSNSKSEDMAHLAVQEREEKRQDITWHIIHLILPLFPEHCFLAGIGHTAAPAFMSDCQRAASSPKHEDAIDMLCILPNQSFHGETYEVSTRRQFIVIDRIADEIRRCAELPGTHQFVRRNGVTATFKRNTTVEIRREAPDNILKPRYLFPGVFVEIKYKEKALVTIAIEINTGIDTIALQQAIIHPGVQPIRPVNIYGMAILLYYGMRDNQPKLKCGFDTMMTKCHNHLEAVRLGRGGPDIIPAAREPPSDNFIAELIDICDRIFQGCIIIDYRNTGKNMLDYLLKFLNPGVECVDMKQAGQHSYGLYNDIVGEVIGNRLLQLAYGVVDNGIRITMRQAINAAIGEIDIAITPLGGIIAKSGGEVPVYKGMPDKFHHSPLFSTRDIDTKLWLTKPANRDQIYKIITDKLIALVKYVSQHKFMDNYVGEHKLQFPTGVQTRIFGKCIDWNITPCGAREFSASARTIKINPYTDMRATPDRTPITLFSMDTYVRSTYTIYNINMAGNIVGPVLMGCMGYLVCSPLDIAIVPLTQPFDPTFVEDVPGQGGDIKLKILTNRFMNIDIDFLLKNKARLDIPGKHEKDMQRSAFFKSMPGFRTEVVGLLSSCYGDGARMFASRWTEDAEAFFDQQAVLVLAAAKAPKGKYKTPKNPGEPDENDHRDADGGMDLGGGGNAVLNKINTRTRRRVKKYKQKSNKLTRNKKRRSYKSSSSR